MATTPVFTFQDACEYVWETMNPATKPPTGRELRLAKSAVISAYRDLPMRHKWNYYKRRQVIKTDAAYSTGTIAYDHTGGANERMVTLTGGTWPTNAARGIIVISDVHYPVETRVSDSIITLGSNLNPGADVASSTTYQWYRDAYPLPVDFRRMLEVVESNANVGDDPLTYVDPGSHLYICRTEGGNIVDDPEWFTVRSNGDYLGSMDIVFGRAPSESKSYDVMYEVSPPELRTYKYATGTVTVSAGSTSVTGGSTVFSAFHVGSIIRFTESTTVEPTSVIGNVDGADNPFIAQRMITAVGSATGLTIDSAVSASSTLTGTKYVISDPIDVEPLTMRLAFEALCLYHFARMTKRKDANLFERDAEKAILYAMDADRRVDIVQSGMLSDDIPASNWGSVDTIPE